MLVNILGARFGDILSISEKTNVIHPQRNAGTTLTKTKVIDERKKRNNEPEQLRN